jgi:hypothetical protein
MFVGNTKRALATPRGLMLSALVAFTTGFFTAPASADIIVGTLSTSVGASIPSSDVAAWLNASIPNNTQRLVVLTECYGGNTLQAFDNQGNTAVLSATSPGQKAIYGGYDVGASKALTPGAANTGATVHAAGVANKAPSETPITGGGLAPMNFSLVPTMLNGVVQSREVLVYAGKPDSGGGTSDVIQRNTIVANFMGQLNTNVRTIGGPAGAAGWGYVGSAAGLQMAIMDAGTAINAANDSSKQQVILFVTDHGGTKNVAMALNRSSGMPTPNNVVFVPGTSVQTPLVMNFATFTVADVRPQDLNPNVNPPPPSSSSPLPAPTPQQAASPTFSILVPFADNPGLKPTTDLLAMGAQSWTLMLTNTLTNQVLLLPASFQQVYNPLNDLTRDAGIEIAFQLPQMFQPGTPGFDQLFFGQKYNVSVENDTNTAYFIGEFAQDAPDITPGVIPEPSSVIIMSLGLVSFGLLRLTRRVFR